MTIKYHAELYRSFRYRKHYSFFNKCLAPQRCPVRFIFLWQEDGDKLWLADHPSHVYFLRTSTWEDTFLIGFIKVNELRPGPLISRGIGIYTHPHKSSLQSYFIHLLCTVEKSNSALPSQMHFIRCQLVSNTGWRMILNPRLSIEMYVCVKSVGFTRHGGVRGCILVWHDCFILSTQVELWHLQLYMYCTQTLFVDL